MFWIQRYTVNRADFYALRGFIMTNTFGAFIWINDINFITG